MGLIRLNLLGLHVLILSIGISSGYHRYSHYRPRHIPKDYSYPDDHDHSSVEEDSHAFAEASASAEDDSAHDVPNIAEIFRELSQQNQNTGVNDTPDDGRANRPINGYEVTERVDDIPNPMQNRPILANYSTPRPLNFAGPAKANLSVANKTSNNKRTRPVNHDNVKYTHEDFFNFDDILPDVKESFEGVKTSLASGLYNIKKQVLNQVSVPATFLNKIHRKANDVINKVNQYFDINDNDSHEFESF